MVSVICRFRFGVCNIIIIGNNGSCKALFFKVRHKAGVGPAFPVTTLFFVAIDAVLKPALKGQYYAALAMLRSADPAVPRHSGRRQRSIDTSH